MRIALGLIGLLLATPALAQDYEDTEFGELFDLWEEEASGISEPRHGNDGAEASSEIRDWVPWWLADRQPRQFGDWYVWQVTDELDPHVGHIMLTRTRWRDENRPGPFFGFLAFEGQRTVAITAGILTLDPRSPKCDWRDASYAVDGGRARYLVDAVGGNCDKLLLSGQAVQQFRAGTEALVRVQGNDFRVSLVGFSAALRAAQNR